MRYITIYGKMNCVQFHFVVSINLVKTYVQESDV